MTVTFEQIITDYGQRIADAVGLTLDADDRTPTGFPAFLNTATTRLSPIDQTADWLTEAADDLDAYNRLGGGDEKSLKLLDQVHNALYDATSELEMQ